MNIDNDPSFKKPDVEIHLLTGENRSYSNVASYYYSESSQLYSVTLDDGTTMFFPREHILYWLSREIKRKAS